MAKTSKTAHLQQFIERVAAARVSRQYTQEQIAKLLGISQPTYSKYEFRSYMPHGMIEAFTIACGVSVEWLMTGKGRGPALQAPKEQKTVTQAKRGRAA